MTDEAKLVLGMVAITGNTYTVYRKIKALSPLCYWDKEGKAWMVPEEHAETARMIATSAPPKKSRSTREPELSARQAKIEELRLEIALIKEKIRSIEGEWLAEVAKLKRKRVSTLEIGQFGCESPENTEHRCVFVANLGREDCLFCGLPFERK